MGKPLKERLARAFPSNISGAFDNTKRLSDYISALARLVFIGPLALLTSYWISRTAPAFSLEYVSLLTVALYFSALTIAMFVSFSWLTAGCLYLIVFNDETPSLLGHVVAAAISLLLIGALAVTLYEVVGSSTIVKEAMSTIDAMKPQ